ncbi:MAG: hypothetical protein M3Z32_11545, partial [Acidobacteriota bacterium]|nr:hypothetical protein [Acidobacteriota bacterium]
MSLEALESWKTSFEIAGVVLLLLTFIAGSGVLWFSRRVNAAQAAQLRQFDKGLTDAKTDLAIQQERAAIADARAKEADIRIAEAQRGSAEANVRATKAQESLALAEQHSAEASAKAEGFRLEIAKANESAAQAQARAAEANLELARFRAPRSLSVLQQSRIGAR